MTSPPRQAQIRRWAGLVVALLAAIIGVILINNTADLDLLGIALVVVGVSVAFVTSPPEAH
ncbi:hypothetical protein ACFXP7_12355 [Microbacterium sp. P06]|uniref:hypothetical protein n=1 Tax=Microbacterium sp. P06 TaxID=3366949 RepID=UPI0037467ED1